MEQNKETTSVYYGGLTWAIQQKELDLSKIGLPDLSNLSDLSVLIDLSIEENKNISSSINNRFLNMLAATKVFDIHDFSDLRPDSDIDRVKKMHRYSICPEITEFEITESEESGIFLKVTIVFIIENYLNNNRREIPVTAIGWGTNRINVIANSIDKITNQFEYVIGEFEELTDNFKIADIFQGSVVINNGKKRGIKAGDFFYSYDYQTGKKTGNFVVERTEQNLSYARILDTKVKPQSGDPLKPYNYLGILSETYIDNFFGDFFSGYVMGTKIIWTRWLYTVNPIFGLNRYELTSIDGEKIVLMTPYLGLRVVRYIKSFSFSTSFTFDRGYVSETEIARTTSGWKYYGGTVKAEISKRIMKHFFIHAEGGFSGFFSPDYDYYPEITGFVFGGGIGLKL